jgi:hypothetical protein
MTRAKERGLRGAPTGPSEAPAVAQEDRQAGSTQEEIARLRRELDDARRQQAATADVLRV